MTDIAVKRFYVFVIVFVGLLIIGVLISLACIYMELCSDVHKYYQGIGHSRSSSNILEMTPSVTFDLDKNEECTIDELFQDLQ